MKTLLAIAFTLFCLGSFAQEKKFYEKEKENRTPGEHLQMAERIAFTGVAVAAGGVFITGMGIFMAGPLGEPDSAVPIFAAGGVMAFVGAAVITSSFIHIGRAGEKMSNLQASLSPVGAKLTLRF